jgi:hypothetical protein
VTKLGFLLRKVGSSACSNISTKGLCTYRILVWPLNSKNMSTLSLLNCQITLKKLFLGLAGWVNTVLEKAIN